jgi:gamma-glutamyl hercynylcysteine S-oxide synthase
MDNESRGALASCVSRNPAPGVRLLELEVPNADAVRIRSAGKDVLSLALIDARNHTLRWIAGFEAALGGPELKLPEGSAVEPPLWALGHAGWYAEYWIARNVQRQRGEHCDPTRPKLASILPEADRSFDAAALPAARRGELALPELQTIRQYLVDTLETTLELLDAASEDDDALYFYRLALFHEDAQRERLAVVAQTLGLDIGLANVISTGGQRPSLLFPATRWRLGSEPGGFVFDNEKWAHEIAVPEFEIDAQPVTWAQYSEFVEDGGYDDRAHWSEAGWAWVQRESRRTPRHVDQMRQGVLQQRFGRLVRVPLGQSAVHLSWHEAEAWCRWAGRRLPSEVEWEAAAMLGASRGFVWGSVLEWTAPTFRPYPGFVAGPDTSLSSAAFGTNKSLRGASFATAPRLCHPKRRSFAPADHDEGFVGFRSCAL